MLSLQSLVNFSAPLDATTAKLHEQLQAFNASALAPLGRAIVSARDAASNLARRPASRVNVSHLAALPTLIDHALFNLPTYDPPPKLPPLAPYLVAFTTYYGSRPTGPSEEAIMANRRIRDFLSRARDLAAPAAALAESCDGLTARAPRVLGGMTTSLTAAQTACQDVHFWGAQLERKVRSELDDRAGAAENMTRCDWIHRGYTEAKGLACGPIAMQTSLLGGLLLAAAVRSQRQHRTGPSHLSSPAPAAPRGARPVVHFLRCTPCGARPTRSRRSGPARVPCARTAQVCLFLGLGVLVCMRPAQVMFLSCVSRERRADDWRARADWGERGASLLATAEGAGASSATPTSPPRSLRGSYSAHYSAHHHSGGGLPAPSAPPLSASRRDGSCRDEPFLERDGSMRVERESPFAYYRQPHGASGGAGASGGRSGTVGGVGTPPLVSASASASDMLPPSARGGSALRPRTLCPQLSAAEGATAAASSSTAQWQSGFAVGGSSSAPACAGLLGGEAGGEAGGEGGGEGGWRLSSASCNAEPVLRPSEASGSNRPSWEEYEKSTDDHSDSDSSQGGGRRPSRAGSARKYVARKLGFGRKKQQQGAATPAP